MSSPLIPFLVFTALSQRNIINQQRMISRRRNSSRTYAPKLPEKMSVVLDKAGEREKGVSYFDILMMRAIHSDEQVQQVITKIDKNYTVLKKQAKENVVIHVTEIAGKLQSAYTTAQSCLDAIRAMGFNVKFPENDYSLFYVEDDYTVKGVLPSSTNKDGFETNYFSLPKTINGLDINSSAFEFENPFEKQLEDFLKENPNYEENLNRSISKVKKLKRNKLKLMFSKNRRLELDNAQREYNTHLEISNTAIQLRDNVDSYNALSAKQKETIKDFIQNIKIIKALSSDSKKYVHVNYMIEKSASKACPSKDIKAYHSALIKKAASLLPQEDIVTLAEFEDKAADKILSLTDGQAKEIIKNSSGLTSSFEIYGNVIDSSILYEISDSCCEKIDEVLTETQAVNQDNKEVGR